MNRLLRVSAALTFALGLSAVLRAARPNVIILLADDLGYGDLSSYGSPDIRTPNIDSIGRNGIRFTNFYSNAPECSPSRTALLTGRHPQRVGGLECAIGVGNVGRYDEAIWLQQRGELGLPASEGSIGQWFKAAGYATAMFGKWHLGYDPKFSPRQHGFDEALALLGGNADYVTHTEEDGTNVLRHNDAPVTIEGHFTDIVADRALAWLAAPRAAPYLLYLPFTVPHSPYQAPGDGPVSGPWNKGSHETYRRMIEHLDRRVGDILRAVAQSPAADNTLVVFLSDNGAPAMGSNKPLRGGKTRVWEGGIRVPCLIQWPAVIRPGLETAFSAQNIDLTATLLGAADIAPPAGRRLDGESFLPVLRGRTAAVPRTLFWRYKRENNRRKAVLDGDYKLVIDNGQKELFHLAKDPAEEKNLIATMPEKAAALEAKLSAWEEDVRSPRLRDFQPEAVKSKSRSK